MVTAAVVLRPEMTRGEVTKAAVLEGNVGYLRIAQTETNLPNEIQAALNNLAATNSIVGIVVDLRFAKGGDAGDLKATEEVLEQQRIPLAILVNTQTRGAAASLAGDLREHEAGLIFGGGATNLEPDISVTVSASEEKKYFKSPYGVFTEGETNLDSSTNFLPYIDIDHTSEADLVREKQADSDGEDASSAMPAPDVPATEPQKPFLRDPVLARGVDFIKGVAALRLNKG